MDEFTKTTIAGWILLLVTLSVWYLVTRHLNQQQNKDVGVHEKLNTKNNDN